MENHPTSVQSSGIRVRVSDLLFAVQKRWTIILALSFIGLVFGLILSAMTYVRSSFQSYQVRGSFAVTSQNANGMFINNASAPNNNDYHLAEDMMDAAKYILRSDRVMSEVINKLELLGYTPQDLKNAITLTQYNTTQIMEMSFTWRNAEESVAIWNEILDTAGRLMPETLQMGALAVINQPEAELVGVGGGGSSVAVLLTLLGFAAGLGYAVIELLMHPTLNNVRDVETMFGLETIGVIPQDSAHFRRKGSLLTRGDSGSSTVTQNYAAAAYILRNRLGTREKNHCFYVTSAIDGEGKSTVAANLAIQLSDMEHRTLLIDFDTRNPSLGALFLENVDYAHSLNALYHGDATEEEAITTLTGYLDLLPAVLEHNVMVMDGMIVELFRNLCEKYEYVILDAPPVGLYSDTLSLNQIVNTVLYVIGYDKSTIPEIQNALEKLDKSGIRVLGCIVNGTQSTRNGGKDSDRKPRRNLLSGGEKNGAVGIRGATVSVKADAAGGDEAAEITGSAGTGTAVRQTSRWKNRKKSKKPEAAGSEEAGTAGTAAEAPAEEKDQDGSAQAGRNLMEDLMAGEDAEKAMSEEDTVSALLKMGIEGKTQHTRRRRAESEEDFQEDFQEDEPEEAGQFGEELPEGEPEDMTEAEPTEAEPFEEELQADEWEDATEVEPEEAEFFEEEELPAEEWENEEMTEVEPEEAEPFAEEELPEDEQDEPEDEDMTEDEPEEEEPFEEEELPEEEPDNRKTKP